jgi:hypothetical protein
MCRSIMTLRVIEHDEGDVEAAALQFVRKISGFRKPSAKNEVAFNAAVQEIAAITQKLLDDLGAETLPAGTFELRAPQRINFTPSTAAN